MGWIRYFVVFRSKLLNQKLKKVNQRIKKLILS